MSSAVHGGFATDKCAERPFLASGGGALVVVRSGGSACLSGTAGEVAWRWAGLIVWGGWCAGGGGGGGGGPGGGGAGGAQPFPALLVQPLADFQVLVKVFPPVRFDGVSRTVPGVIAVPVAVKFVGVLSGFCPPTSVILKVFQD